MPLTSLSLAGWQGSTATLMRSMAMIPGDHMVRVNLSRTQITSKGLAALLTHCHRLAHLNVSSCPLLKSAAMECVVVAARRTLETIDISNCPNMCKDAFLWLAGRAGASAGAGLQCRRLRTVDASNCERMSDAGVAAIGACRRISCLNLAGCTRLSDAGPTAFCRSPAAAQSLLLLDLSQCFQVTDVTLLAIGERCARLQSLLLSR